MRRASKKKKNTYNYFNIHNFIEKFVGTNKMQKVKGKNEWHANGWNFSETGYELLLPNERHIHEQTINRVILHLIDQRMKRGKRR